MKRKDFLRWGSAGLLSTIAAPGIYAHKGYTTEEQDVHAVTKDLPKETIHGRAMVCASQPLAAAAGYDVLKNGGNAVDAAIAVNAMLCLTEPMMCGIGGDLFVMVWNEKDKKLYGLNASGRSPYHWSAAEARKLGLPSIPSFGPLSWSVPGCVSGWDMLLTRFGSKQLPELLQPVIRYAKEGFPVSPIIASGWKPESKATDISTLSKVYFTEPYVTAGSVFRNPGMAKAFELLANEGAAGFYRGEIAERIVRFSKKLGGKIRMQDMADHSADWTEPVSSSYREYDIWQLPPNGQGIVVLQMMNLLEQFDIASLKAQSAAHFHLFLEAKKLCFQDRSVYYADTAASQSAVQELISKEYARKRAMLINTRKASVISEPGRIRNGSNTVYLSVADAHGNMVSLIQSLYSPWGSHCVVDELGFALQNRGALFSLNEQAWNRLEPHKRPLHTIIPSFVTRQGRPQFSFGVTGGDFQPQGQVQILTNIIDHHMPVQQAGDQLRLWHREGFENTNETFAGNGHIIAEPGFPKKIQQQLSDMGHAFSDATRWFGGYQGIWRLEDPRRYIGASDFRKDGCVFGF